MNPQNSSSTNIKNNPTQGNNTSSQFVGEVSNKVQKQIADIQQIMTILEKEEDSNSPNYQYVVKLQRQLIRLFANILTEQRDEYLKINQRLNQMNKRLKNDVVPYANMEKVANILKPFLAKSNKMIDVKAPLSTSMSNMSSQT